MELIAFVRILLRRWWLIVIPVAITVGFTLPTFLNGPAPTSGGFSTVIVYSAVQSFSAIPRTEGDYQDIWLSSEYTVNAFSDWVTSGSFRKAVTDALTSRGIAIDEAQLSIASDNERSVGQIFLSYPNAELLQAAADEAIRILQTRSHEYFAQLGGEPAAVTILDQTPITPAPPPITDRLGPFLRIGIGLLGGIALALLAHYLDPTLRHRDEVEWLGVPVLTTIPPR